MNENIKRTAKENRYSQICGVINTGIYAYLMYKDKLYGTAVYDLVYCIPIQIYTFYTWGKDKSGKNKKEISRFSYKQRIIIIFIVSTVIVIYSYFANMFNKNYFYALVDSFSIILGMVGLYFVSQKRIEQWYAFIISNIITIIYWIIKCIETINNLPMLLMWTIYLINNSYGLYTWTKKLNDNK